MLRDAMNAVEETSRHLSVLKRNAQTVVPASLRPLRHTETRKDARNAVRSLKLIKEKKEALGLFPKVVAMLDRLAKRNIIHRNKASNLKGKLAQHINSL